MAPELQGRPRRGSTMACKACQGPERLVGAVSRAGDARARLDDRERARKQSPDYTVADLRETPCMSVTNVLLKLLVPATKARRTSPGGGTRGG